MLVAFGVIIVVGVVAVVDYEDTCYDEGDVTTTTKSISLTTNTIDYDSQHYDATLTTNTTTNVTQTMTPNYFINFDCSKPFTKQYELGTREANNNTDTDKKEQWSDRRTIFFCWK